MNASLASEITPFSYLAYLLGINPAVFLWQITFESMMILAGGILILAGGEE